MTQSMTFVIILWQTLLQVNPSLTHKCFARAITSNFWGHGGWTWLSQKLQSLDTHGIKDLISRCHNNYGYLIVQTETIVRWNTQQAHGLSMCPWRTANLRPRLLGYNLGQKSMASNQKYLFCTCYPLSRLGCTSLHGITCQRQYSQCLGHKLTKICPKTQQMSLWPDVSCLKLYCTYILLACPAQGQTLGMYWRSDQGQNPKELRWSVATLAP